MHRADLHVPVAPSSAPHRFNVTTSETLRVTLHFAETWDKITGTPTPRPHAACPTAPRGLANVVSGLRRASPVWLTQNLGRFPYAGPAQRTFNVEAGGLRVAKSFDIFAAAQGWSKPTSASFDVDPVHNELVLELVPVLKMPTVHGIEVLAAGAAQQH